MYVLAWISGLMIAPSAPDATASDSAIQAFFVQNDSATLLQALLVHGVAGVALAVFVVALARQLAHRGSDAARRALLIAGVGAATVSIVQLGIEIALNRHVAGNGTPETTASLFHAINVADTVKLVLLGIAIAAARRLAAGAGAFPRWVRGLGYALLPVLVIGGLAFIVDSSALTMVLDASLLLLLLLLLWASSVSVVSARRPQRTRMTAVADR